MDDSPRSTCLPAGLLAGALALLSWLPGHAQDAKSRETAAATRLTVGIAETDGAHPLTLDRAEYEVDVYGSMAVVRLTQHFRSENEEERGVVYSGLVAAGVEIAAIERMPDEGPLPFTIDSSSATLKPRRFVTEEFDLEERATPATRLTFRLALGVADGYFQLALPAVGEARGLPDSPLPVNVVVNIHRDEPLHDVRSASHEILSGYEGDRTVVELVRRYGLDARPFLLELAVLPRERPVFAGYVGPEVDGIREITAVLEPPAAPVTATARPKQIFFVLDTSGSMRGDSIVQARESLLSCLEKLEDHDRFNIVEFDSKFTALHQTPLEAREARSNRVEQWIAKQEANGGTNLLPALEAAFAQPEDPERHRMFVLITDGMLADEEAVLEVLEQHLGEGRLFVVGIGRRIRQETILRLAEYGRGAAAFSNDPRQLQEVIDELFDTIAMPLAWDVTFDFGAAEIEELRPARFPDLYAGRSVRVLARVTGQVPDSLRARMTTTTGIEVFRVRLPPP